MLFVLDSDGRVGRWAGTAAKRRSPAVTPRWPARARGAQAVITGLTV